MNLIKRVKHLSGMWLGSSVVECSHSKRATMGPNPSPATFFPPLWHLLDSLGESRAAKMLSRRFQHGSE